MKIGKTRRLAGMSSGFCLFVVVLSVLSLSCLDFTLGPDFCPVKLEPPLTPTQFFLFRLDLSLCCGGLNSARASLNTGLFLHILLSFRWLFRFFLVFAIGLLRRFLYPILDPPFTRITFVNMAFSKAVLNMVFSKTLAYTCFRSNLNRGLNKTNVFASKPSFTQRAVLHKNCVIHKHHVLHQNRVLAGPVQGLFHGGRRNTPKPVKYMCVYIYIYTFTKSHTTRLLKRQEDTLLFSLHRSNFLQPTG